MTRKSTAATHFMRAFMTIPPMLLCENKSLVYWRDTVKIEASRTHSPVYINRHAGFGESVLKLCVEKGGCPKTSLLVIAFTLLIATGVYAQDVNPQYIVGTSQIDAIGTSAVHGNGMDHPEFRKADAGNLIDSGNWKSVVRNINEEAYLLVKGARWSDAIDTLTNAVRIAETHPEEPSVERARTLDLLGYVYSYLDRFEDAGIYLREAITISENGPVVDGEGLSEAYYVYGLNYRRMGRDDSALVYLSKALALSRALGAENRHDLLNNLLALGNLESDLGAYDLAECYLNDALTLLKQMQMDTSYEAACCYHYLVGVHSARAEVEQAVNCEERALRIARRLFGNQHPMVLSFLVSLGDLHSVQGDNPRASEYFQEALRIYRARGTEDQRKIAWVRQKLAATYGESGDLQEAIKQSEKSLIDTRWTLGVVHPDVASGHSNLALLLLRSGNYSAALAHIDSALSIYEALGTGYEVMIARLYAEKANLLSGTDPRRMPIVDSAQNILTVFSNQNPVVAAAAFRRAGDALAGVKPDVALRFYEKALCLLVPGYTGAKGPVDLNSASFLNGRELLETILAKSQLLKSMCRRHKQNVELLNASLQAYEAAAEVAGRLRSLCRSETAKLALSARIVPVYDDGIQTCLERYSQTGQTKYLDRALWFSEGSKARVLLEGMAEEQARNFGNIPHDILRRERRLQESVAFLERCVLQTRGDEPPIRDRHLSLLFAKHRQLDSLRTFIEDVFPELTVAQRPGDSVQVQLIQGRLDPQSAMLEYFCGRQSITLFVIQKNTVHVTSIRRPRDLEELVHTYLWALRTADAGNFMLSSCRLYDILVRPVEHDIRSSQSLVVVPDDILSSIPFESLISKRYARDKNDYTHARFLIRSHDISYTYSAAYWSRPDRTHVFGERNGSVTFAGFAPVFSDSARNGMIASVDRAHPGLDAEELRSVTVDGKRLSELPYSRIEVSRIANAFSRQGERCAVYLYGDATKSAFEREAGQARFVHLATHGIISESHPELSALLFSQPPDAQSSEEGTLYSNEIYNLRLNADLIVLSSCESGVGKLVRGEGMMAMTRGFFQAGARNVMVSLWRVLDESTATLMLQFYQYVLRGDSYSKALRAAKLRMIQEPLNAAPAKWAGFILIGK